MVNEKDIMSVEYTEMDNGCPALCFCSDLVIPITNKTMVQSYCNYMDNDMIFKVYDLHIQTLMISCLNVDISSIKAKINGKFEFMGFVDTTDLYNAMKRVLERLKEGADEN
jgi:hypothetical protein